MACVDHLLDQCAPICYEMGFMDRAIDAIQQAVALCDANAELVTYRRKRFDAYLFLARVCADAGDYIRNAEIYDMLETHRADSPFFLDDARPLCPREVREKAEAQRGGN